MRKKLSIYFSTFIVCILLLFQIDSYRYNQKLSYLQNISFDISMKISNEGGFTDKVEKYLDSVDEHTHIRYSSKQNMAKGSIVYFELYTTYKSLLRKEKEVSFLKTSIIGAYSQG